MQKDRTNELAAINIDRNEYDVISFAKYLFEPNLDDNN